MTARAALGALALYTLACPAGAAAHAPPQVFTATFSGDDTSAVLLTNRGLIFGDLTERRWRLMCNEALGVNSFERPDLVFLPDGSLLVATTMGLKRTLDGGCTWQGVNPFASVSTPALVQASSGRAELHLAVFGPGVSGIHVTRDAGASWSRLLAVADNDFVEEIVLASEDTIYASGQVFDDMGNTAHYVTRSRDGGDFERFEVVALLENEADFTLLAVSPTDPDRLLARALDNSASTTSRMDRLLLSSDGGETFISVLPVNTLVDARFSTDGSTAWAAAIAGLWRSTDAAVSFTQIPGPERMTCTIEHDGSLWGCGFYAEDQDGIGTSADSGDSFAPLLAFTDVTEPVACDEQSPTALACAPLWQDWQLEILSQRDAGTGPSPVAGAGGAAGPDAGATPPDAATTRPPARRDDGCAVRAVTERDAIGMVALAALICARERRRRVIS